MRDVKCFLAGAAFVLAFVLASPGCSDPIITVTPESKLLPKCHYVTKLNTVSHLPADQCMDFAK